MSKIGILVSATDTGTTGTGAGVWDGYMTALKGQISGNPQYREEPPITPGKKGAEGHKGKYDIAAQTLAGDHNVSIIVTAGALAAKQCQKYNPNKPLVVASAGDFSALTGNNFTGCKNGQTNTTISDQRIQIMKNKWNPVAVMVAGNDDVTPVNNAMTYVLGKLGNKGHRVSLKDNNSDLPNLQATLYSKQVSGGINVLYVCSDPFVRTNGDAVVQAAHNLGPNWKTMHEFAEWVIQHGGDLSYGPNFNDLFRTAGGFVDRIFNHNTPAGSIPIFNPQVANCVQVP
jgi:ABC-type uncharacterized transport system substrate-binding protein